MPAYHNAAGNSKTQSGRLYSDGEGEGNGKGDPGDGCARTTASRQRDLRNMPMMGTGRPAALLVRTMKPIPRGRWGEGFRGPAGRRGKRLAYTVKKTWEAPEGLLHASSFHVCRMILPVEPVQIVRTVQKAPSVGYWDSAGVAER